MSNLTFQGHELPKPLCLLIRRLSLKDIGLYNGDTHRFFTPILDPNERDLGKIKESYDEYEDLRNINHIDIANYVNRNTTVDPIIQTIPSIHIGTGDKTALKKLQHIEIEEQNEAITHLLYLEKNRFLVLKTTRSTIHAGDVLQANSLPINVGEQELFSIYRNGEIFIPTKLAKYDTSFRTKEIRQIKVYKAPELYEIIDEHEGFGNNVVSKNKENLTENQVISLLTEIQKILGSQKSENLPDRAKFPKYDELLALSKSNGIDSYTLNLIIESSDCLRFDVIEDCGIVDDDWYYTLTPDQKKKEEKDNERKYKARYEKLLWDFQNELKKIRTRRVMIIFKAEGRIGEMSYINQLEGELDALADNGFGVKGAAKQMRLDAIANSKPKKGENLLTAAKLVSILVFIVAIGWIWIITNRNMEIFNYKMETADKLLAAGKYVEAKEAYHLAYEEYRPKITAMLAQAKMRKRVKLLEVALNEEIENGIAQIAAMRVADNGKFSKTAEDILFRLIALAPEDSRLLDLRTEWLNQ